MLGLAFWLDFVAQDSPVARAQDEVEAHPESAQGEWVPPIAGERSTVAKPCSGMGILELAREQAVVRTDGWLIPVAEHDRGQLLALSARNEIVDENLMLSPVLSQPGQMLA